MSYFTPSTKLAPARYDLLDKHEEAEREQARLEMIREPYVNNGYDAVWVGDRIPSV